MAQKYKGLYRNGDCIHKNSCRYILQGLLRDQKHRTVNSLTLPATNFILEKRLVKEYEGNITLHCCEINPKIYKAQQDIVASMRATTVLHNKTVLDIKVDDKLNFIWLDFCGYLTESLFNSLLKFLENVKLRDSGVFALTFQSSRQSKDTVKFYRRLQRGFLKTYLSTLQNFTNQRLPEILKKTLDMNGKYVFTPEAKYSYKPSSGGGMMTMYAFSWDKA